MSERNLFVLKINTSDAVMLGTEHCFVDSGYVTSRFQVILDSTSIVVYSYLQFLNPYNMPRNSNSCRNNLNEDFKTIFNN